MAWFHRTARIALALVVASHLGCARDRAATTADIEPEAAAHTLVMPHGDVVVEGTSLLGEPLYRPDLPPEVRERLEADLAEAQARFDANPRDEDAIIWLGRRLGYLGRYNDAVAAYTQGLRIHPTSHRLLRHRGHRFISLRRLDAAVADLARASAIARALPDEVEQDGAPNELGIPRSTTKGNIEYHLALALYLQGRFDDALAHWDGAWRLANNDDTRVAVGAWRYRTLARLGREDEAKRWAAGWVRESMDVIENFAYQRLLLAYLSGDPERIARQGWRADETFALTMDGLLAERAILAGDRDRAGALLTDAIESGANPYSFAYIACEAELARLRDATR
ncbi:MAG: tetratricopeptide repeat protein [Phycisphaerales bacterium]